MLKFLKTLWHKRTERQAAYQEEEREKQRREESRAREKQMLTEMPELQELLALSRQMKFRINPLTGTTSSDDPGEKAIAKKVIPIGQSIVNKHGMGRLHLLLQWLPMDTDHDRRWRDFLKVSWMGTVKDKLGNTFF